MANVIRGTNDSERIDGTYEAEVIFGKDGDDTIYGGGGRDTIFGGAGNDFILAGRGSKIFAGDGDDTIFARDTWSEFQIYAGKGDDTILFSGSLPVFGDKPLIHGGAGVDTIVFSGQSFIYQVDVASVERFVLDRSCYEVRALEDQIFTASGKMKVEVIGATDETGSQRLTVGALDGKLDASKLVIANWDDNDLVELWGADGDDLVIGSDYVDFLIGWAGNDTLDGGAGADWLRGGAGKDVFVIDAACGPDAIDTIEDFTVGDDRIRIDDHGLGAKRVGERAFHVGTEAADKHDRFIYDRDTGALYFDRDGSRSGFEPVKIAQLSAGLDLSHTDFLLG